MTSPKKEERNYYTLDPYIEWIVVGSLVFEIPSIIEYNLTDFLDYALCCSSVITQKILCTCFKTCCISLCLVLLNGLLLLADKDFSFSTFIFWHSKFLLWPLQQNVFGKRGGCFCRWVVHSMQIRVACKIDKSFLKEIYLYSLHHMHSKRWSVGKFKKECKKL